MVATDIEGLLRAAGWFPGRIVPTAPAHTAAAKEGFPWWAELADLVAEFDGLTIRWENRWNGTSEISLDAADVIPRYEFQDLEEYRLMFRTELTPIGAKSHYAILAGTDGRFFGAFEDSTSYLGNSLREALTNLIDQTYRLIS